MPESENTWTLLKNYLARIGRAVEAVTDNVTVAEWIVEREEVTIADVADLRRQCDCFADCDGAVTYAETSIDRRGRAASCDGGSQLSGGRMALTLDRGGSVRYLRRMVSTWEVVLGTVGGLMSIFVGFSFVCILELVYFLTLREKEVPSILCSL